MASQSDSPPNSVNENTQNPATASQPAAEDRQDPKPEAARGSSPASVFVNSEPIREDQVQNAVKFLSHPKVRGSPVMYRRSFLERKGLTKEEIDEAFLRVPDPNPTVTSAQPVAANEGGTQKPSSTSPPQAALQNLQPASAPSNSMTKMGYLSHFRWTHAVIAVGLLAASGAGTAVLFKKSIIPRLKSWIRKVVLDEEDEKGIEKGKPSLAEEAAVAAKAAAAAAADVARASQEMLASKSEEKRYFEELTSLLNYQVREMKSMTSAIEKLEGITNLKQHLYKHFQTKDLGRLKYFLGIEVAQSTSGIVISQRKYALEILEETGMMGCKPIDTLIDPNVKLLPEQGEPLSNPERYRWLVGKLNYLAVTRPDISFVVSIVSQFMNSPCASHWDAVVRILRYIKSAPSKGLLFEDQGHEHITGYTDVDWAGSPSDRRSTSEYCVLVGGNLVSWKSKKQNVVAQSSAEAEYRAMAATTCELVWIKQLLRELKFGEIQWNLCDNQAALQIASNLVFHERTKHIEIDCHFVREKILSKDIVTKLVKSIDQLADIFTKFLTDPRINYICNKLGAYDLYAPASGGLLE